MFDVLYVLLKYEKITYCTTRNLCVNLKLARFAEKLRGDHPLDLIYLVGPLEHFNGEDEGVGLYPICRSYPGFPYLSI